VDEFIRRTAQTKTVKAVRQLLADKFQIHLSLRQPRRPKISIVVVLYNIPREAPRTLRSLSPSYQRHIDANDYEIIVVDNGSIPAVDATMVAGFGNNFRLIRIDPAPASPAHAVNRGIAEAKGEVIGVMVDGARIASPGLLHFAYWGAHLHDMAVVAALGWYLGFDFQRFAMQAGYDRTREDALLASIAWPQDGYRLFEVSTMDESSVEGWFFPLAESNALFMRRELWSRLEGVEERFNVPGGGLLNLDTYTRAMAQPGAQLVILLGEGTFHQLHGGVATNRPSEEMPAKFAEWDDQYEQIRGHRFRWTIPAAPIYVGVLPRPVLTHFAWAATRSVRTHPARPLGANFDRESWCTKSQLASATPALAAAIELAQQAFRSENFPAAVSMARLIRSRFPNEAEPQRLLAFNPSGLDYDYPLDADYFFALGEVHRLLGDQDAANSHYRHALSIDQNFVKAHIGLATQRLPGDYYLTWLDRFYTALAPETVIEIGVFDGQSIARVHPPTVAIGIDPNPMVSYPLTAETHIFTETSDAFFARGGPDALLAGRPLGVGFIDGLHLYEQALKDFINLERYCGPRSVILFHDTVPLDEATQSRARDTQFHTGDVWKTVLCLKHYRPELDIFTIATPWTGLTVVAGLDPASQVLANSYDEAVARFIDTPFAEIENRMDEALNIVANDWRIVEELLKARRILFR
jgi:tetratricopeptide (TPR) repeat protein